MEGRDKKRKKRKAERRERGREEIYGEKGDLARRRRRTGKIEKKE